ncbi:MAG TPA: BadF/BadG/BcrA/BcrD ATPase family protein [Kineosporiaceae bacterium]
MTGLVVGVDGGNSKTDVVIADLRGRVLAHVRGPGTRPDVVGVPATADLVAGLVRQACHEAGAADGGPLAAGAFHWANLDLPHTEAAALRELAARGLAERLVVRNDTFAVLRAGAPRGWGVAIVAGAGINACGVAPTGRTERFLALGEITGDVGGGWSLSVTGIGAAVRAGDGRGRATALRRLLPPVFGLPSVEEVAVAYAEGRIAGTDLLAAAPVVALAAERGDQVALEIMLAMADEVVTMAVALIRRLELVGRQVPVVLGGSAVQGVPGVLLDAVVAGLARRAPGAEPLVLDVRPVAGSVLEALDLAGAAPDAAACVRAALRLPGWTAPSLPALGVPPEVPRGAPDGDDDIGVSGSGSSG